MEKKRPPHETKDIGIARLKRSYEKTNNRECPPSQIKFFEKMYEKEFLVQTYEGHIKGR